MNSLEKINYFYARMIETLRAFAADYDNQSTIIPQEIMFNLGAEMIEEFDYWYNDFKKEFAERGLLSAEDISKIDEVNVMVQLIIDSIPDTDYTAGSVKDNSQWEDMRQLARETLEFIGEEVKPPRKSNELGMDDLLSNKGSDR